MGIHYDYKSTRGAKAMEKQAKREKKLAERRAKRAAKDGVSREKEDSEIKMHDISKTITLLFLVTSKVAAAQVIKTLILSVIFYMFISSLFEYDFPSADFVFIERLLFGKYLTRFYSYDGNFLFFQNL